MSVRIDFIPVKAIHDDSDLAIPDAPSKDDAALISSHREFYADYLSLNRAIWGAHSNGSNPELDSDYSAAEISSLAPKKVELAKLNVTLATMLSGLQTSYKSYYNQVVKKWIGPSGDLSKLQSTRELLNKYLSQCSGLAAKVRFMGSILGES